MKTKRKTVWDFEKKVALVPISEKMIKWVKRESLRQKTLSPQINWELRLRKARLKRVV